MYIYLCVYICICIYSQMHKNIYPRLRMNRVTVQIFATQRASEMDYTQGSWNREISRFAIASPDNLHVFMFSNHVQNGHVWLKGQNITGLICTGGYVYIFICIYIYNPSTPTYLCACLCLFVCLCLCLRLCLCLCLCLWLNLCLYPCHCLYLYLCACLYLYFCLYPCLHLYL